MKKTKIIMAMILLIMFTSSLFNALYIDLDEKIQPIKENPKLIRINLTNTKPEKILYSKIFSGISIVPLETTSKALIGQIHQIKVIDDTIYVFDKTIAKCLFIFDIKGKFISKIGNIGKGPEEYVSLGSFSINNKSNTISFFDDTQQKIIVYNKSGEFLHEIRLNRSKIVGKRIACKKDNYFIETKLYRTNNPTSVLQLVNNEGKILKRWFSFPTFNKGWDIPVFYTTKSFYTVGDDIRYYNYFNDTVFSIVDDEVYPFLSITSPNPLTQKDVQQFKKNIIKTQSPSNTELYKTGKYFGIRNYLENNAMIMFMYHKGFYGYTIIVDKKTHQFKMVLLKDDLTNNYRLGQFCECTDDYYVNYIKSWSDFMLLKKGISEGMIEVSQDEQKAISHIKMEDNPVLILYTLKK